MTPEETREAYVTHVRELNTKILRLCYDNGVNVNDPLLGVSLIQLGMANFTVTRMPLSVVSELLLGSLSVYKKNFQ